MNKKLTLFAVSATGVALISFATLASVNREDDGHSASTASLRNLYGTAGSAVEARRYTELATMVDESAVVVVGAVESVELFRVYQPGSVTTTEVTIRASEVLADNKSLGVRPGDLVRLELPAPHSDGVGEVRDAFLGHEFMWFLLDQESEWIRAGASAEKIAEYAGMYILVSSQGLVLNDGGRSLAVWLDATELPDLAGQLNGEDFSGLGSEVTRLAE